MEGEELSTAFSSQPCKLFTPEDTLQREKTLGALSSLRILVVEISEWTLNEMSHGTMNNSGPVDITGNRS